ncbi:hypothetical protein FBD94_04810 [Pedobacter hiemivivus]|uniref:Tetratricopeptide repeat protein n=1 Tax=Pedobacter hiemivivus TaxID=2530454 RepID=A0A4U1GHG4_9SPHI|nr:hypothetical protein [Pedobacter hiemivivus]TKC63675.1 hypothetical protein FBD94_04810 [Pedobacter hiemivivus]
MKFTTNSPFRFLIFIALTLYVQASHAQVKLNGSYVATKVNYLSGDELPEDNILKYTYLKYTFSNQDQIGISGVYYEKGTPYLFAISGNRLIIKSEVGSVMNTLKIMENNADKLVLISSSASGSLEDPWAIKYTLYKEQFIQNNTLLSPNDIFSIKGTDTVYKSGQKIYAQFKGSSFQSYMYELIRKKKMDVKSGELLSTFIIDPDGHPDSLRIIQGINPKYDAEYIKAFNSARNMWQPAQHNGKTVTVLMNQSLKYLTSEQTLPSYFDSQKANTAYNNKDYELALYHYDRALEVRPDEVENLYHRGICKQILGNLKGACADWTKIQLMGNKTANELLLKYCK